MGTAYNTNVVSDGLIACWDAGNRRSYPGAGTTWTDLAGAQNGTMENMNTGGFDSQKGGIIEFDGTDEYVDMGSSNQILPGGRNPFTISLWLKPDSQGDTQEGLYSFNQPDDDQEGSTTYAFGILWEPSASGETYAFYAGQRGLTTWGPSKTSGASREDWVDTWCCITITYNGEGTKSGHANYRFYINDVNYALSDIGGWGGAVNFNRLGNVTTVTTHSYTGDMANISIYNRALSAAEVKQNYEATKPRFTPRITKSGMFASWDAGDPASYPGGTTLKDTANHYDGTFVNNGSGADISFDSANGGSLVFDGSDDYVNITTLPDYSGTARSAIIWFNVDDMDGGIYTPFQSAVDQFCVSFGQYETGGTVYVAFRSENSGSNYTYGVSTTVSDGVWTCWAVTIDASDEIVAVYQNGDSKSLAAGHGFSIKTGTTIGCRLDGSTVQNDLDGKVGSLRLYTKTLSAAEVMDNFQKTRGRFGV